MKRCILCLAVLLLAACGSSGALYLPGQETHKGGLQKKQRKNDATPAVPAETPPAAPEQPAAPPSEAAPAPATDSGSNPPPAPPQP
jgi:predicted small lipoprotein YifL